MRRTQTETPRHDAIPPNGTVADAEGGRFHLLEAIREVCREFGLADLYVFGSRAQGVAALVRGHTATLDPNSRSDLDIGVRPLPGNHLDLDRAVGVAAKLEALFGVPRVDVVDLVGAEPFLALEVIRGELLYCEDPDAQAEHELYVLRRAGDLAPFQRARQDLVLSRYLEP